MFPAEFAQMQLHKWFRWRLPRKMRTCAPQRLQETTQEVAHISCGAEYFTGADYELRLPLRKFAAHLQRALVALHEFGVLLLNNAVGEKVRKKVAAPLESTASESEQCK